MVLVGNILNVF